MASFGGGCFCCWNFLLQMYIVFVCSHLYLAVTVMEPIEGTEEKAMAEGKLIPVQFVVKCDTLLTKTSDITSAIVARLREGTVLQDAGGREAVDLKHGTLNRFSVMYDGVVGWVTPVGSLGKHFIEIFELPTVLDEGEVLGQQPEIRTEFFDEPKVINEGEVLSQEPEIKMEIDDENAVDDKACWKAATHFLDSYISEVGNFPWSSELEELTGIGAEELQDVSSFLGLEKVFTRKSLRALRQMAPKLGIPAFRQRKDSLVKGLVQIYREMVIDPEVKFEASYFQIKDDYSDDSEEHVAKDAAATSCLTAAVKEKFPVFPACKIRKLILECGYRARQKLPVAAQCVQYSEGVMRRIHENAELYVALLCADALEYQALFNKMRKCRGKSLIVGKKI